MSARTSRQGRPGPAQQAPRFQLPDGTRSAGSPWVWRGFLFMSLIAFGLCLSLALSGHRLYAIAWAFVTVGWFSIAMWLWRRHLAEDPVAPAAQQGGRRR
jgi:hypothetical protein